MLLMGTIVLHVGLLLAPIFAILVGMALSGHVLQTGFVFSAERLKPDFSKLSPLSGLKRLFGLEGISNLVKGLIKIAHCRYRGVDVVWPMRSQFGLLSTKRPPTWPAT